MFAYKIYNKENNKSLTKKEFRQRFGEQTDSILSAADTHFKNYFFEYDIEGTNLAIRDRSKDIFFSSCKTILVIELVAVIAVMFAMSATGYQDTSIFAHKITMIGGGINMLFAMFAYMFLAVPNENTDWQSLSHTAIFAGAGLLFASRFFLGS